MGELMSINFKWMVLVVLGITSVLYALPTRKRSRAVVIPQDIISRLGLFASEAQDRNYQEMYLELSRINKWLNENLPHSSNRLDLQVALSLCSSRALASGREVMGELMNCDVGCAHLVAKFGELLIRLSKSSSENFKNGYEYIYYALLHLPEGPVRLHFEGLQSYCEGLQPDLCVSHGLASVYKELCRLPTRRDKHGHESVEQSQVEGAPCEFADQVAPDERLPINLYPSLTEGTVKILDSINGRDTSWRFYEGLRGGVCWKQFMQGRSCE